jgi:hypothetical protein
MLDFDFSVEHVLMFMIAIFLLYHLVNNCGCMKDGFCIGTNCKQKHCQECSSFNPFGKHCDKNLECRIIENIGQCPGKVGSYCVTDT